MSSHSCGHGSHGGFYCPLSIIIPVSHICVLRCVFRMPSLSVLTFILFRVVPPFEKTFSSYPSFTFSSLWYCASSRARVALRRSLFFCPSAYFSCSWILSSTDGIRPLKCWRVSSVFAAAAHWRHWALIVIDIRVLVLPFLCHAQDSPGGGRKGRRRVVGYVCGLVAFCGGTQPLLRGHISVVPLNRPRAPVCCTREPLGHPHLGFRPPVCTATC